MSVSRMEDASHKSPQSNCMIPHKWILIKGECMNVERTGAYQGASGGAGVDGGECAVSGEMMR